VNPVALTVYVLMWPAIVAGMLYVICHGFVREWIEARRKGQRMV
jgi:hypothetical protein